MDILGWQRGLGGVSTLPDTTGTYIAQFSAARFTDQQNHRLRAVANGATVKLYLDGVLGPEIAFPFSNNLEFGFGAYANFANNFGNPVKGFWDNALVQGFPAQPDRPRLALVRQGANHVITWTGTATLQTTTSLSSPITWTDVTPAPTGNSYTLTTSAPGPARFYRLR